MNILKNSKQKGWKVGQKALSLSIIIKIKYMTQVKDLKAGFSIYGNKGNVWSNTAHIFQSGNGNLCGTPALASNWARIEGLTECGCKECNEMYNKLK